MKKLAILFAMMFAVALWFGSTVSAGCVAPTSSCNLVSFDDDETGEQVKGSTIATSDDVDEVTVTSCGGKITVEVLLVGNFVIGTKYRVHFDYKDGSGDILSDFVAPDPCNTTSDDTIKLHRTKTTGPEFDGNVSAANNTLIFEVAYADLEVNETIDCNPDGHLVAGDIVYIWVDTHYQGIRDRAPGTRTDIDPPLERCSKPQLCEELLVHTLSGAACPQ